MWVSSLKLTISLFFTLFSCFAGNFKAERSLKTFIRGTWCPSCRFKSEGKCREIFEELLNTEFIKRRFECMEYLELDGYSEEYNLAFEYNGQQHEKFIKFFHKDETDFEKQQERDEKKKKLCEKNNIDLIVIPSTYDYTKPKKLRDFIYQELVKNSYIIDKSINKSKNKQIIEET